MEAYELGYNLGKRAADTTMPVTENEAEEEKPWASREDLINYLNENPYPNDEEFHRYCEENNFDPHQAESVAYDLATDMARFLRQGKKNERQQQAFDQEELDKGEEIEREHTDDSAIARRIAQDHLTEHPRYYTALEAMEKMLEDMK